MRCIPFPGMAGWQRYEPNVVKMALFIARRL